MAAKTSYHRYGTKLRHSHPMYRQTVCDFSYCTVHITHGDISTTTTPCCWHWMMNSRSSGASTVSVGVFRTGERGAILRHDLCLQPSLLRQAYHPLQQIECLCRPTTGEARSRSNLRPALPRPANQQCIYCRLWLPYKYCLKGILSYKRRNWHIGSK